MWYNYVGKRIRPSMTVALGGSAFHVLEPSDTVILSAPLLTMAPCPGKGL
jgi:hypothetical protein